jgi:hypothetical protein
LIECKSHLTHENILELAKRISDRYVMEINDIEQDITKTKVF